MLSFTETLVPPSLVSAFADKISTLTVRVTVDDTPLDSVLTLPKPPLPDAGQSESTISLPSLLMPALDATPIRSIKHARTHTHCWMQHACGGWSGARTGQGRAIEMTTVAR